MEQHIVMNRSIDKIPYITNKDYAGFMAATLTPNALATPPWYVYNLMPP